MRIAPGLAVVSLLLACVLLPTVAAQTIAGTYRLNDLPGLRHAVENDPENAGLRLRLTQALLRPDAASSHPDKARVRLNEAQVQFQKVLALNSDLIVPLRVMALEHYMNKNLEAAVEVGSRLIKIAPEEMEVTKVVLKALVRLKRFDEAADTFVGWLKSGTTPSFGGITGLLSILVIQKGFRSALETRLLAAVEDNPGSVDLHLYLSIFYLETGRSESAWRALHQGEALGLCDTRTASRHAFARILASRAPEFTDAPGGLVSQDIEELGRHHQGHPKHVGLAMRYARMLDLAGRRKDALVVYQKVNEMNPSYWASHYRCGKLLLDHGAFKEAADMFAKARVLFPAHRPGRLMEAEARVKAKDSAGAVGAIMTGAESYEPGSATQLLIKLMSERGYLDALVEALRGRLGNSKQPYLQAHLALALKEGEKVNEAQKTALSAERAGLSGRDGYPSAVLYDVFGEDRPAATAGSKK